MDNNRPSTFIFQGVSVNQVPTPIQQPRLSAIELEDMLHEVCVALGLIFQLTSTMADSTQAKRIHQIKRRLDQVRAARPKK